MTRSVTYNFGAGSLEDLQLKVWTAKADRGHGRQIKLSLKGSYRVYCGNGWEHTQPIDIVEGAWEGEAGKMVEDILKARNGDADAAFELSTTLVQMELDDVWEDPCDEYEEEVA